MKLIILTITAIFLLFSSRASCFQSGYDIDMCLPDIEICEKPTGEDTPHATAPLPVARKITPTGNQHSNKFSYPINKSSSKKIALVIGNSKYHKIRTLTNPIQDASAISKKLASFEFDITLVKDATRNNFIDVLNAFEKKAKKAKIALIFYAGHGMQIGKINYLIPIDSPDITEQKHINQLINVNDHIIGIVKKSTIGIVILDACRDNPFVTTRTTATRSSKKRISIGRGLARIPEVKGILIAYAAKAGKEAQDGFGRHSPFTQGILNALTRHPNMNIDQLFTIVRGAVVDITAGEQEPEIISDINNSFFLSK